MPDQLKEPFVKLSEQDKERYYRQKNEFESKGYFTLEDGSKSTDLANQDAGCLKYISRRQKKSPKKLYSNSIDKS